MKITNDFVFFWGGILSNWAGVSGGITTTIGNSTYTFPTSEHIFMYLKAVYFKDYDSAEKILTAKTPKEAKKVGRSVSGFSEAVWNGVRENAMMKALRLKAAFCPEFTVTVSNPDFKDKHFVEASPFDRVWGIGMSESEPGIEDPENWKGLNLLGKCLDTLKLELYGQ